MAVDEELWERLREAAVEAMRRAYAPYSGYAVGAAGLTDDGRIVAGCNVENASYGLTLCAECGVVSELHRTGSRCLTALVCVNRETDVIMPCGRCRQLLFEHAAPGMLVATENGAMRLDELLPHAFGPNDVAAVKPGSAGETSERDQAPEPDPSEGAHES